jgi:hypothetical protein
VNRRRAITGRCALQYEPSAVEIRTLIAELQNPVMSSRIRSSRIAAGLGVLILVAAMLPACAMMCCALQTPAAARMMAAMPCCANVPSLHSPHSSSLQDATLTAAAKSPVPVAIAAVLPNVAPTPALSATAIQELQPDSAPTAPAFLRNEQFRI